MFWGYSEALDLIAEYNRHIKPFPSFIPRTTDDGAADADADTRETPQQTFNILLFGSGDARHILKTIAKIRSTLTGGGDDIHPNVSINFYIVEGCLEILARQILLVNLALEPAGQFSLRGKVHTFMDLHGNALLRPSSNSYMTAKATEYLRAITDLDGYARTILPNFNFSRLRYTERDALETVFTFWLHRAEHNFSIANYWDQRVRRHLGTRYDTRNGAFDWDLSMRLREYGAQQLCPQEYKHWRDSGVAFVYPEYEQTMPNKTLAAAVARNGSRFMHRGYVGDITVGPFCAYGLVCAPDASMQRSQHGTNEFRATDITERNLSEIMYEIECGQPYKASADEFRQLGASTLLISKHLEPPAGRRDADELRQFDKPSIKMDGIQFHFLPVEDVIKIVEHNEFNEAMDVVFVAQTYLPFVKQTFRKVFRPNGGETLVLFETRQLSVLRKNEIEEFLGQVKGTAADLGLSAVTHFNLNLPLPIVRYKNDVLLNNEK